jgi:hypothetical protein
MYSDHQNKTHSFKLIDNRIFNSTVSLSYTVGYCVDRLTVQQEAVPMTQCEAHVHLLERTRDKLTSSSSSSFSSSLGGNTYNLNDYWLYASMNISQLTINCLPIRKYYMALDKYNTDDSTKINISYLNRSMIGNCTRDADCASNGMCYSDVASYLGYLVVYRIESSPIYYHATAPSAVKEKQNINKKIRLKSDDGGGSSSDGVDDVLIYQSARWDELLNVFRFGDLSTTSTLDLSLLVLFNQNRPLHYLISSILYYLSLCAQVLFYLSRPKYIYIPLIAP